jgi:hypothetical protein
MKIPAEQHLKLGKLTLPQLVLGILVLDPLEKVSSIFRPGNDGGK